jgi:hypothetical protein
LVGWRLVVLPDYLIQIEGLLKDVGLLRDVRLVVQGLRMIKDGRLLRDVCWVEHDRRLIGMWYHLGMKI